MAGVLRCVTTEADGTGFYHIANKAEPDFLWLFWLHIWVDVYKGRKPAEGGFVTIEECVESIQTW